MTIQKASFQQGNQTQPTAKQAQVPTFAPSHEQMTSYVYGLLSSDEGEILERRAEQSPSFQEALEASQKERAFFDHWTDVPVPSGLSEKTLLRIQELDHLPDSSDSVSK